MKAPLDYAKPGRRATSELAVARKKATGPGKRLGSLLVNPGGPGGSAIGYLQQYAGIGYPAQVRARYDMVAIDPRGVARSEPVECLNGRADGRVHPDGPDPGRRAGDRRAGRRRTRSSRRAAARARPDPAAHVSTVEAARDMDILRAVLGDEKLTLRRAPRTARSSARRTPSCSPPGRAGSSWTARWTRRCPRADMNLDQTAGFETAFQSFAEGLRDGSRTARSARDRPPPTRRPNLKAFFTRPRRPARSRPGRRRPQARRVPRHDRA